VEVVFPLLCVSLPRQFSNLYIFTDFRNIGVPSWGFYGIARFIYEHSTMSGRNEFTSSQVRTNQSMKNLIAYSVSLLEFFFFNFIVLNLISLFLKEIKVIIYVKFMVIVLQ